jgi:transcriptional regulator with XRE-family HTH domain
MKRKPPPERDALLRAFTKCLRDLRRRHHIAQEALAAQAGIDRAYMGGLERGKHMPSLETLYKIAYGLAISYPDFAVEFDRWLRRLD